MATLVILVGHELPFGSLIVSLTAAWSSPKFSRSLSLLTGSLLSFLGILLAQFLSFSFFTAPTLAGLFSALNLDFFFHTNRYLPNFWTVQDLLWTLLALALAIVILLWRTR